jgi:hypothetical protein
MIAVIVSIALLAVLIVTVCSDDIDGVTDRTYHGDNQ